MIRMPSPAMIVALVALFVASTGTAVAGALITGANVKNNSLTGLDVLNGSLTTTDVKNHSLLPIDFKGKLPAGPAGPQGPVGAQGAQGPQGQQGPQGAPGVSAYARSFNVGAPFDSTSPKTWEAPARLARSSSPAAAGSITCRRHLRRSRSRSPTRSTTTPGASSGPRPARPPSTGSRSW